MKILTEINGRWGAIVEDSLEPRRFAPAAVEEAEAAADRPACAVRAGLGARMRLWPIERQHLRHDSPALRCQEIQPQQILSGRRPEGSRGRMCRLPIESSGQWRGGSDPTQAHNRVDNASRQRRQALRPMAIRPAQPAKIRTPMRYLLRAEPSHSNASGCSPTFFSPATLRSLYAFTQSSQCLPAARSLPNSSRAIWS
jgi:hypothetical protein